MMKFYSPGFSCLGVLERTITSVSNVLNLKFRAYMAAIFSKIYQDCLTLPVHDLKKTIYLIQDYYSTSKAIYSVIMYERLVYLQQVGFKRTQSSLLDLLSRLSQVHIRFISAVWREIRSSRVGLTDKLIEAVSTLRHTCRRTIDIDQESLNLKRVVATIDALLLKDYSDLDIMDSQVLATVSKYVSDNYPEGGYTVPVWFATDTLQRNDIPVACKGDAFAEDAWISYGKLFFSYTKDVGTLFADDEEKCLVRTDDIVLSIYIDKAIQREMNKIKRTKNVKGTN